MWILLVYIIFFILYILRLCIRTILYLFIYSTRCAGLLYNFKFTLAFCCFLLYERERVCASVCTEWVSEAFSPSNSHLKHKRLRPTKNNSNNNNNLIIRVLAFKLSKTIWKNEMCKYATHCHQPAQYRVHTAYSTPWIYGNEHNEYKNSV